MNENAPRPETISLLQEMRRRDALRLPTGFINCRNCDSTGCDFCEFSGTEPTFSSPESRDRFYEWGGDFHMWPPLPP